MAKASARKPETPSGLLEIFATGAKRSMRMPRYDLIPMTFFRRMAQRFTGQQSTAGPTGGALKYGECNWEKGMPTSDTLNHTIEHLLSWADKFRESLKKHKGDMREVQKDMQEHARVDDDLAGAAFGLGVLMYQEQEGMFHDDTYKKPE